MASDLVLRLCQVDEDEGGFASHQHIALHDFVSAMISVIGGYHTGAQLKTFYDMPANQQAQFDALWSRITSAPNLSKQLARIRRFESVLHFWERRDDLNINAYDTPDDIETQLLAIDEGFL